MSDKGDSKTVAISRDTEPDEVCMSTVGRASRWSQWRGCSKAVETLDFVERQEWEVANILFRVSSSDIRRLYFLCLVEAHIPAIVLHHMLYFGHHAHAFSLLSYGPLVRDYDATAAPPRLQKAKYDAYSYPAGHIRIPSSGFHSLRSVTAVEGPIIYLISATSRRRAHPRLYFRSRTRTLGDLRRYSWDTEVRGRTTL
ncbi:hypothetical protein BDN67DRAFT_475956 [Paxillus ammoniavirescens]|nr:hypothetical protein BDN67DRAFT_475956 [Paxillus ammoniavirescens]